MRQDSHLPHCAKILLYTILDPSGSCNHRSENCSHDPTMSALRIPLLLLKTPTGPSDAYTTLFTTPSPSATYIYSSHYVPVLIHTHHLESLYSLFEATHPSKSFPYGGLIFTSARAVEAFAEAVYGFQEDYFGIGEPALKNWLFPLYAVGPATADAIRGKYLSPLRKCEIVGEEAGSGEALAPIILKDYASRYPRDEDRKPLLFLAGKKHKDVIPRMLRAERVEVQEMVIYSTVERTIFPYELEIIFEETEAQIQDAGARWIVIFSAAGAKEVLKALGWLDQETGRVMEGWDQDGRKTFVASIGPTTRDYLRKEFGFQVDVCAEKPSPEGVKEGIEAFMRGRGIARAVDDGI